MKTIGLIGGTSWESTAVYYRLLNEGVRARLGGLHSAPVALVSLDFAPLADAMAASRWDRVGGTLAAAARQLEAAGAEVVALATNTMHKVADAIVGATRLPFLDLRDVTGQALGSRGVRRPLLLATRYTMEDDFYCGHLRERFGVEASIPEAAARGRLQEIIFAELCRGAVTPAARADVLAIIAEAERQGCDGVIFGCTEIGLLLTQADVAVPILDTTALHCNALLDFALTPFNTATSVAA